MLHWYVVFIAERRLKYTIICIRFNKLSCILYITDKNSIRLIKRLLLCTVYTRAGFRWALDLIYTFLHVCATVWCTYLGIFRESELYLLKCVFLKRKPVFLKTIFHSICAIVIDMHYHDMCRFLSLFLNTVEHEKNQKKKLFELKSRMNAWMNRVYHGTCEYKRHPGWHSIIWSFNECTNATCFFGGFCPKTFLTMKIHILKRERETKKKSKRSHLFERYEKMPMVFYLTFQCIAKNIVCSFIFWN